MQLLYLGFCCYRFLERLKHYTVALVFFSLIIVKSLQLRGRRQIAEPRKYCLVRVIVFSLACVFSIFYLFIFVSHRLGISG